MRSADAYFLFQRVRDRASLYLTITPAAESAGFGSRCALVWSKVPIALSIMNLVPFDCETAGHRMVSPTDHLIQLYCMTMTFLPGRFGPKAEKPPC